MLIVQRHRQKEADNLVVAYAEQRIDRRALLQRAMTIGLSMGAALALLAACDEGNSPPTALEVLNVWSGEEQASFRAVVAPFTKATGIAINLEVTRNLNAALTIRTRGNNPPDIAVMPNPPQLRQLASQKLLISLDTFLDMAQVNQNYAKDWRDLASYNGHLYALVYKAANKGTIWYSPTSFQQRGYALPTTWEELLALSTEIARSGQYPWALGVENDTASGWPAADWVAEIYLKLFGPKMYDQWIAHQIPWTHDSIKQAFQLFGQIVGGTHYIAGAPQTVLDTSYDLACYEPFSAPPQAYMDYLGDFATGFITAKFPQARPGLDFNFFPFPTLDPAYAGAVTGGADLVVAMRDNTAVRQFMTYLSSADAQAIWVKRGGATSINRVVDLADYPNNVSRASARMLIDATTFRFGAGDLMPVAVQKTFWQQIQRFIADQSQLDSILTTIELVAQRAYNSF